ncbi:MAG: hypothetical protein IKX02_00400 [Spirochaetales bacterium]|nr:hypothetical protein [Spirochaetales bacterium]
MACSLRELYPTSLDYIRDQAEWLLHIRGQRPLCSHQELQARRLLEELERDYPDEAGIRATLEQALGCQEIEARDILDDLF